MPKETEDGWVCNICGAVFKTQRYATNCEEGHNIVFVKFKRDDLFRLCQFVMTKDETLLSPSLMKTLSPFFRGTYL